MRPRTQLFLHANCEPTESVQTEPAPYGRIGELLTESENYSIVGCFEAPPSLLEHNEVGRPVLEQHLETSPAPGGFWVPPTFIDRPRPGPAQDLDRHTANNLRHQVRGNRSAPATACHPDRNPVGTKDLDN